MRYRKKPILIEAIQWDGSYESQGQIVTWSKGAVSGWFDGAYHLVVETLEGTMRAEVGDWIIRGVQGEFYPCKPDIFEATYSKVLDDGEQQTLDEEALEEWIDGYERRGYDYHDMSASEAWEAALEWERGRS